MLKMVDGTGIIGVDMVCPLGGTVSPPQPPNYDKVEVEGVGSLMLPNSLKAPLERVELLGNSTQGENPAPDNPQEIKNAGKRDEGTQKYEVDVRVARKNLFPYSNDFSNWKKGVNNSYFGSVTSDESGITLEALKPYSKMVSPTFKLKPNTEYTVSAIIDTKDNSKSIGVRIFKNLNVSDYLKQIVIASRKSTNRLQKVSATFTTDDLKDTNEVYLQLDCSWGNSIMPVIATFSDIQIELGNEATPYQPYTEQTLTITSDRPITKWDKLVEQGGQYGWLYQSEVKEYRGENSVSLYDSGFYFLLNNKNITKGEGYCSELKQHVPYEKNPCISFNIASNTYAYTLNTQEIYGSSVSEIKEYLKIHPLHLVYKTEATEFVPLSESEQTQLRNLHSYNGTTHITVDSGEVPCGIKLTYRKEI